MLVLDSVETRPKFNIYWAMIASPVVLIFLSSNFVNIGNLVFNMLFSRWMGPELYSDLALVQTIKLFILAIFGSLQLAVTRHVAIRFEQDNQALSQFNKFTFISLCLVTPFLMYYIYSFDIGQMLGMQQPKLLLIIFLSFPFSASLSILRGVVQGQIDVKAILLSANVEMVVRLTGAIFLWQMGYGIEGVIASITVSIIAGWLVISNKLPKIKIKPSLPKGLSSTLAKIALPFALLQASQVLLLDGEIFAAKIIFDETTAGLIAAAGLFQRIEFFACFGLVGILIPTVAKAVARGESGIAPLFPVAILFALVTIVIICAVFFMPKTLTTLLVGSQYLLSKNLLLYAAGAASAFTFSYLLVTFLTTLDDFRGIWIVASCVPLQISAFIISASFTTELVPEDLLLIKFCCQIMMAVCLLFFTLKQINNKTNSKLSVSQLTLK
jgi:O-antigen/teichoic acid export membrane protein